MKKTILLSTCIVAAICLLRCNNTTTTTTTSSSTTTEASSSTGTFNPVPFPDTLKIPGFTFPTDSTVIDGWLTLENTDSVKAVDSIYYHGWGIWAGLTTPTSQKDSFGAPILVFETWDTPGLLQEELQNEKAGVANAVITRKHRAALRFPDQFKHSGKNNAARTMLLSNNAGKAACNQPQYSKGTYPLYVAVAYDIPAASHILNHKLYDTSVLNHILASGVDTIPDFPVNSIALKPTYEVIPKAVMEAGNAPFRIPNGPNNSCELGYGQSQWPCLVYIDWTNNKANIGNSGMDCDSTGPGKNPKAIYNLNQFIYYRLTAEEADSIQQEGDAASAGDYVILVAMHVTTKETKRWTWQSFFWIPNVATPPGPSDPYIPTMRPPQMTGAPAHYAMAIGYTFTWPNQPYTGGNEKGYIIYSYNPFLEAGFGSAASNSPANPTPMTNNGTVIDPKTKVATINKVGGQTNCMSCHALATYTSSEPLILNNPNTNGQTQTYYADTYIDMLTNPNFNDPHSKYNNRKKLQLDFLWSIDNSIIGK